MTKTQLIPGAQGAIYGIVDPTGQTYTYALTANTAKDVAIPKGASAVAVNYSGNIIGQLNSTVALPPVAFPGAVVNPCIFQLSATDTIVSVITSESNVIASFTFYSNGTF